MFTEIGAIGKTVGSLFVVISIGVTEIQDISVWPVLILDLPLHCFYLGKRSFLFEDNPRFSMIYYIARWKNSKRKKEKTRKNTNYIWIDQLTNDYNNFILFSLCKRFKSSYIEIKISNTIHFVAVSSVEGSIFNIMRVNRLQMGAYLCIASNSVPPTVSKRIMLIVHCEYI